MIRFIQWVSLALGFFFLYQSYSMVKRKREDMFFFLTWSGVGMLLVIFSFFYVPILEFTLGFMGMSSRVNFLFSATALLCLFLSFVIFKQVQELSFKQARLVQEISLLKAEVKRKDKK